MNNTWCFIISVIGLILIVKGILEYKLGKLEEIHENKDLQREFNLNYKRLQVQEKKVEIELVKQKIILKKTK